MIRSTLQILSVCLSVCPNLVRYLLRDGWVDWAEILHVDAEGLNLGFPLKKSIFDYFSGKKMVFSKKLSKTEL
jgi:hypothetical protein